MDIARMLAELRAEREQIEEAIIVLENLARGQGKRRGRPPKWMAEARHQQEGDEAAAPKRSVSPEARRKMAEAQRKRWAAAKASAADA